MSIDLSLSGVVKVISRYAGDDREGAKNRLVGALELWESALTNPVHVTMEPTMVDALLPYLERGRAAKLEILMSLVKIYTEARSRVADDGFPAAGVQPSNYERFSARLFDAAIKLAGAQDDAAVVGVCQQLTESFRPLCQFSTRDPDLPSVFDTFVRYSIKRAEFRVARAFVHSGIMTKILSEGMAKEFLKKTIVAGNETVRRSKDKMACMQAVILLDLLLKLLDHSCTLPTSTRISKVCDENDCPELLRYCEANENFRVKA